MRSDHKTYEVPKHQTDAALSQAAPVQNTWYTILDTTPNCRVYCIVVAVATTGEDLECRLIIDGVTYLWTAAAAAATNYWLSKRGHTGSLSGEAGNPKQVLNDFTFVEGRSVKVEVRKTSIAGAGTITGRVTYGKW